MGCSYVWWARLPVRTVREPLVRSERLTLLVTSRIVIQRYASGLVVHLEASLLPANIPYGHRRKVAFGPAQRLSNRSAVEKLLHFVGMLHRLGS